MIYFVLAFFAGYLVAKLASIFDKEETFIVEVKPQNETAEIVDKVDPLDEIEL